MTSLVLAYHDVIERGAADASGFAGPAPALYKLSREDFAAHLAALADAAETPPSLISSAAMEYRARDRMTRPWFLTFDDGGVSSHAPIADRLEERNWRGHFFVTTGRIDTSAFLSRAQVLDLHARGHVIGAHSHTHPARMSSHSAAEIEEEWRTSVAILSEITGAPVRIASVPNGFYSRAVARAAAQAGIGVLFTSEPTIRVEKVDGCWIVGRFTIRRQTPAREAARLVEGKLAPRLAQAMLWSAKDVAKRLGGEHYLSLRRRILSATAARGWNGKS